MLLFELNRVEPIGLKEQFEIVQVTKGLNPGDHIFIRLVDVGRNLLGSCLVPCLTLRAVNSLVELHKVGVKPLDTLFHALEIMVNGIEHRNGLRCILGGILKSSI